MTERLTYDQITELLLSTDLGTFSDGNTVQGTIASYVNGMMQGLYNISKQDIAVKRLNTQDPEKDIWKIGHDAVVDLYVRLQDEATRSAL